MSSKNTLIVVFIILGSFLIVAAVAYLRQSGLAESFDKGQRFTAKPGTTREKAMILTSDKRPTTADPKDSIARRGDQDDEGEPLDVKSLSKSNSDGARSGPAGEVAREAMSSYSPEAGLRKLEAALAMPNTPDQMAVLKEAEGQLHAQTSPPDYDKSLASFNAAKSAAQDSELREEIVYSTAQMLIKAGREDEARDQIDAQLAGQPPRSPTGYKLQIIRGQLLEHAGRLEEAEQAYQDVLSKVQVAPEDLERAEAISLTRLAGLRLTGLYRKNERGQAADTLSAELKRQIAHMEEVF